MAEYFSHDYDAREDEKIQHLLYKLKWEGYGLYWAIIEMLYKNDGYLTIEYERIAHALQTHSNIIKSIIEDFNLFRCTADAFYSPSALHRLKLRKGKGVIARKAAKIRWDKEKQKNADAMQTQCDRNAKKESKVKESKVKKSKVKKNIVFVDFWNLYNRKVGNKKECEKKWNNLTDSERQKAIDTLPIWLKQFSDKQFQPYPETYLNQVRWDDELPEIDEPVFRDKLAELEEIHRKNQENGSN